MKKFRSLIIERQSSCSLKCICLRFVVIYLLDAFEYVCRRRIICTLISFFHFSNKINKRTTEWMEQSVSVKRERKLASEHRLFHYQPWSKSADLIFTRRYWLIFPHGRTRRCEIRPYCQLSSTNNEEIRRSAWWKDRCIQSIEVVNKIENFSIGWPMNERMLISIRWYVSNKQWKEIAHTRRQTSLSTVRVPRKKDHFDTFLSLSHRCNDDRCVCVCVATSLMCPLAEEK